MRNSIKELKKYHLTHIVGADINIGCNDYNQNIIETGMTAIDCLIKGFIKLDRSLALDLMTQCQDLGDINQIVFKCDKKSLDIIKSVKIQLSGSLLEIYPHYSTTRIDLLSFTGESVISAINDGYDKSYCRFWWVGDSSLCDGIELIEECNEIITCKSNVCCPKDV
jgi:hypothetical protein